MTDQLKEGQTAILKNQRHISTAVARTLTYKQFYATCTVIFVFLVISMSIAGKMIRGQFWFKAQNLNEVISNLESDLEKKKGEVTQLEISSAWLKAELEKSLIKTSTLARESLELEAKRGQHLETLLAFKGLLFDEPAWLEEARVANQLRQTDYYGPPHRFDFSRWLIPYQTRTIALCIKEQKFKCLEWIMNEDDWDKHISPELRQRANIAASAQ